MTRKTKTFASKKSRNKHAKKLRNEGKLILRTSDYHTGIIKPKKKYSLTWWVKPKKKK